MLKCREENYRVQGATAKLHTDIDQIGIRNYLDTDEACKEAIDTERLLVK